MNELQRHANTHKKVSHKIALNKISQKQKNTYRMMPYINSKICKYKCFGGNYKEIVKLQRKTKNYCKCQVSGYFWGGVEEMVCVGHMGASSILSLILSWVPDL